jgi:hypothetical protein
MGKLALNNSLQGINKIRTLNDYSSLVKHNLEPQEFNNLEDGLYTPPKSEIFRNINKESDLFFEEMPGFCLGRQEARHEVLFGRLGSLALLGFEQFVAVKQSTQPKQLLGELAMLQYLQDKTSFPTFRPVAYLANNSEGYLFTEFRPDIHVIGMFDWSHAKEDQKKAVIAKIAYGLGSLHANFLYHGDASVRNLALNSRNQFFIVDPELMISGKDKLKELDYMNTKSSHNEYIIGQFLSPMIVDLSSFYRSLIPISYNKITSSQQVFQFIKSYILPPYRDGLENSADIKNLELINELFVRLEKTIIQKADQKLL